MSDRELRELGISLPGDTPDTNTVEKTIDGTTMAATATQVNPYHEVIDLLSPKGKNLHQKATEGLPNDQKYDDDAKYIINFVERVESKRENFGWNSIASNIGPDNTDICNAPGKLTAEDRKNHCDPKWTENPNASNLQFCVKSNMMHLFIKKSSHRHVLENIKEERIHWKRPGGGHVITFLITIYNKNAHRKRSCPQVRRSHRRDMKKVQS